MTRVVTHEIQSFQLTDDPEEWDAALRCCGGHLLQSWRWGTFKQQFGWDVERIAAKNSGGAALAQVLFRTRAGMSIGYIPRGPTWPLDDLAAFGELWARIDEVARRRRTLTIILEPDRPLPELAGWGVRLLPGPEPIQPARTHKD